MQGQQRSSATLYQCWQFKFYQLHSFISIWLVNFYFIFYVHSKRLISYSFESLYLFDITLRVKFKPLTMICKALINMVFSYLVPPHLATLPWATMLQIHWLFWQFLKHTQPSHNSTPLHLVFPLPGNFFRFLTELVTSHLSNFSLIYPLNRGFPWPPCPLYHYFLSESPLHFLPGT